MSKKAKGMLRGQRGQGGRPGGPKYQVGHLGDFRGQKVRFYGPSDVL